MSGGDNDSQARKERYLEKFRRLLEEYPSIVFIDADNIGAEQLQAIRKELRALNYELKLGKNTLMKKAIRDYAEDHPSISAILPLIERNVGLIFCKDDVTSIDSLLERNVGKLQVKVGMIAPSDVVVPAMITNLDPTITSFFASLNIATKITRGRVEIIFPVNILKKGDKVGLSQAKLLDQIQLEPFSAIVKPSHYYYQGNITSSNPTVVPDSVWSTLQRGIQNVRALSIETGIPTAVTMRQIMMRAFQNVLVISKEIDYDMDKETAIRSFLNGVPEREPPRPHYDYHSAPEDDEDGEDFGNFGLFD
eukprot:TRINITY_DN2195_c0_g1_i1.p1 TRINITY_DN2195_c0_g1~~TRINITY_DN2195_c0_g1_i1.p1  ORF type:complete len:307 (+),score=91.96 TRINITY_DN2195_c0_g1_i1:255-1175(+)